MRWGPRLGALVEFVNGVTSCGVTLFKTVEALSRGAFFFSAGMELKTKGAGGGGAGREIMDSNTSLPWILTPRHFLAVWQRVMVGQQILYTSVGPAWKHCLLVIGCLLLHCDWMMCLLPILL